jgi:hypothetical protein
MIKLPNDLLNRSRPLPHALADLVAKHDEMQLNHPERGELARMIGQLEAELTYRAKKSHRAANGVRCPCSGLCSVGVPLLE